MMRIIAAALAGGIVLFVWGFLSWAVLPWHPIQSFPQEDAVRQTLRATTPESGVYWMPNYPRAGDVDAAQMDAAMERFTAKHLEGPVGYMVYRAEGSDPNDPKMLVRGLVIYILTALIAAVLLAAAGIKGYVGRVAFVVLLGALLGSGADLINWNFMHHPLDYTMTNVVDHLVAFLVAGLAMAAIVKPASGMR